MSVAFKLSITFSNLKSVSIQIPAPFLDFSVVPISSFIYPLEILRFLNTTIFDNDCKKITLSWLSPSKIVEILLEPTMSKVFSSIEKYIKVPFSSSVVL